MIAIIKKTSPILKHEIHGRIKVHKKASSFQYFFQKSNKNKYKYLPIENIGIAKDIVLHNYCKSANQYAQQKLKHINFLINDYEENKLDAIYEKLSDGRKALIGPVAKTLKQRREIFENIQYEGKPFSDNDITEHYTGKGERVRSKSEITIADELARYGIAYHYEMPETYIIGGRKVVIYSDFHAMNKRTGKIYIIEHFGLMDDEDYVKGTLWKLDVYERNDILLGRDLIIFHETRDMPLSVKTVDKYIEEYLL